MKAMLAKSGAAQRASKRAAHPEAARAMERAEQRRVHFVNMAAAACAGAATVFTTNPLWVAKTRLQARAASCAHHPVRFSNSAPSSLPEIRSFRGAESPTQSPHDPQVQSMVSLSARGTSPAWNLRRYSGTWDCVARIAKEEGIGGAPRDSSATHGWSFASHSRNCDARAML